ncbi:MAG: hypothetical protein PF549_05065 [Patescibacteria group bacterium]|jgi:hypothetical protein|nr:hypothetical protein [Patescibacteria group bacterium]
MKNWLLNKKNQFYVALIISVIVFVTQWWAMKEIKTGGIWEWFISSFLLFFLLPVLIVKVYFKETLKSFHLSFDFSVRELIITFISGLLFVGLISFLVIRLSWYEELPFSRIFLANKDVFLLLHFSIFPLIVFFKQFLLFGFLLRSGERSIGVWRSVLVVAIFLAIEHIVVGFFSFQSISLVVLTNLFIFWLIFKTRSIFLTSFIAWLTSMVIDFTILYQISLIR